MLTSQRKQLLLLRLQRDGQLVAKALSEELGTSEDTIRRDLRELASEGKLQRVHGGALPASPATATLALRQNVAPDDKLRLARAGASLVQAGQVIIIDGGTTTTQLVRHLPPETQATVVTHSPTIAVELAEHRHIEVILLGGRLYKHSMVAVGASVIEAAGLIKADLYFMGVTGVHHESGLTTGNYEEASVKRALHHAAAETVVMASSEKLGAASPYVICPATEISQLLLPASASAQFMASFAHTGVQLKPVR